METFLYICSFILIQVQKRFKPGQKYFGPNNLGQESKWFFITKFFLNTSKMFWTRKIDLDQKKDGIICMRLPFQEKFTYETFKKYDVKMLIQKAFHPYCT